MGGSARAAVAARRSAWCGDQRNGVAAEGWMGLRHQFGDDYGLLDAPLPGRLAQRFEGVGDRRPAQIERGVRLHTCLCALGGGDHRISCRRTGSPRAFNAGASAAGAVAVQALGRQRLVAQGRRGRAGQGVRHHLLRDLSSLTSLEIVCQSLFRGTSRQLPFWRTPPLLRRIGHPTTDTVRICDPRSRVSSAAGPLPGPRLHRAGRTALTTHPKI